MNKKQTIRKLGSIEAKQTTQPKQTKQKVSKNKVLEIESDNDIENYSEEEVPEVESPAVPKPKKKKVVSDEQKKILVERLAYARSLRKKESENKKVLEEDYLKQKEEEINERIMKKFTSLQRKKENEMMKKYMTREKVEVEARGSRRRSNNLKETS